jgi:hypothetical protein
VSPVSPSNIVITEDETAPFAVVNAMSPDPDESSTVSAISPDGLSITISLDAARLVAASYVSSNVYVQGAGSLPVPSLVALIRPPGPSLFQLPIQGSLDRLFLSQRTISP